LVTHPDHLGDDVLSALADDQLAPDEGSRAQAHLGTCSDCQARLAEIQDLVGLLRALPSVDPPRDFRLGPRPVADPPNVIRLRRWYAWTRAGAGALAAAFVFLSVGTLYVDSRAVPSSATLASKAQPAAPEVATAPQQNPSAPAARNATGGTASDAAAPAPPAAGAPAAQPPAAPAPASAARPAAVPAASPAAQAPGAAAAAPAVRSQAAPAPTSTEPGDQIAAATTVRPLPTQVPTPTVLPQPSAGFATSSLPQSQADPAAPLRIAASVVGVLAAFGILLALYVRHRLQAASPSHLE
jgi:hypothetical protein